jgi:hypothetical protein
LTQTLKGKKFAFSGRLTICAVNAFFRYISSSKSFIGNYILLFEAGIAGGKYGEVRHILSGKLDITAMSLWDVLFLSEILCKSINMVRLHQTCGCNPILEV